MKKISEEKQVKNSIRISVNNMLIGLFILVVGILYIAKTGFGEYGYLVLPFIVMGLSILTKGIIIIFQAFKKIDIKYSNIIIKVANYLVYASIIAFLAIYVIKYNK